MMNRIAIPVVALSLVACTAAQVETAQGYQDKISGACAIAMTLAPVAGSLAPWIIGACQTESEVAKLALDPTSLTWLKELIAKLR